MASISKITPSILQGSTDITLALANLNFDFSLVKVDAPASYHGVGEVLSKKRKNVAENGSVHITARKLAVLFEQILPETPRLVEAYGTRASFIAAQYASSSKDNESAGLFSTYTGIDGTSIWAAATSGGSALSVHLLACML
jgi:hypothetical protein